MALRKNTKRWSQKSITRWSVKQLRCSAKYYKVFWKQADRFSPKLLRNFQQKYWKSLCKNTDTESEKIVKNFEQKQWGLFNRNTETWSGKMLKYVLQSCWVEFRNLTQNEQLSCINSETSSASCYIMTVSFRKPKVNKKSLGAKSLYAKFSYSLKWKRLHRRQTELWFINVKKENKWSEKSSMGGVLSVLCNSVKNSDWMTHKKLLA